MATNNASNPWFRPLTKVKEAPPLKKVPLAVAENGYAQELRANEEIEAGPTPVGTETTPEPTQEPVGKKEQNSEKPPTSNDPDNKKVAKLVVDANAFIHRTPLKSLGQDLYTIPEVLLEVRDQASREFLDHIKLTSHLYIRQPSPESVHVVSTFAQGTGLFAELSAVDLKLIALAYTLEVEANGDGDIVKTPPKVKPVVGDCDSFDSGFFDPSQRVNKKIATRKPTTNKKQKKKNNMPGWGNEGGWITEANVDDYTQAIRAESQGVTVDEEASAKGIEVACLTHDFAMQTVLMQMNLSLLSFDGYAIKKLKQFVLRCFGCYQVVKNMETLFCPKCGKDTLAKCSYEVAKDGKVIYHPHRAVSTRGTIYAIGKPRKLKKDHRGPLILTPGQVPSNYYRRMKKKKIKDMMDPDANPLGNRSDKSVPWYNRKLVAGYGYQNPNNSRKRFGKKNVPF